jgi:hypothetical protein
MSEERGAYGIVVTALHPGLEPLFGAVEDEEELRRRIAEAGDRFQIGMRAPGDGPPWRAGPFQLCVPAHGTYVEIRADATAVSPHDGVDATVLLRTPWEHDAGEWVVGFEVSVDCRHSVDHRSMETVIDEVRDVGTPRDGVVALGQAVDHAVSVLRRHSVTEWLWLGTDEAAAFS